MSGRSTANDTSAAINASACPNCGTPITGVFCAHCGQHLADREPTFRSLIRDAFGEITDLDGRIWRTVRTLLFRPGVITRDYLDGKRARYLPPFRIYLIANVILYFAFPWLSESAHFYVSLDPGTGIDPARAQETILSLLPQVGFVLLPFTAWALQILYLRDHLSFGECLVAALHIKTGVAMILSIAAAINGALLVFGTLTTQPKANWGDELLSASGLAVIAYVALCIHRTFRGNWLADIGRSAGLLVAYGLAGMLVLTSFAWGVVWRLSN